MSNNSNFTTKKVATCKIFAPLTGVLSPMSQVPDNTFANGYLGEGIAITPTVGQLISPVAGKVLSIFPTNHAVLLRADFGAEILIHIGIDTVNLEGKHFTPHIQKGDTITQGQLLLDFDIASITSAGLNIICPICICNHEDFTEMHISSQTNITFNENLITLNKHIQV